MLRIGDWEFITFFAEGSLYDAIVKEQLFVLRSSRLYDAPLTNLYYVVIGRNSSAYSISPDKKFLKLAWLPNGTEVETLQHLYKVCRQEHVSHNGSSVHVMILIIIINESISMYSYIHTYNIMVISEFAIRFLSVCLCVLVVCIL